MNYETRESALRLLLSRGDTLYNFDRKPLSFSRWEKSPRIFHLCSINYIANQTTNNVSFFLKRRILIIRESDEYFSIFLTQLILLIREDVQISFNLRGEIQSENLFASNMNYIEEHWKINLIILLFIHDKHSNISIVFIDILGLFYSNWSTPP